MADDPDMSGGRDFRPMISRLREIQRRCSSLGSRNEEFPLMEERLGLIISRLEAGKEDSGKLPDYSEIARGLFPVAHLFESYGFTSVGREIAHIERALSGLGQSTEAPILESPQSPAPGGAKPPAVAQTLEPSSQNEEFATEDDALDEQTVSRGVPRPVAIGFLVLLISILAVTLVITNRKPITRELPQTGVETGEEETPTVVGSPTPKASTTTVDSSPRARLAVSVGKARLALNAGDVDDAIVYLSEAALVDVDDTTVIEAAQGIVVALIEQANGAAGNGFWDAAEERLERARRISMRFGFPTEKIDATEKAHASMVRFQRLRPENKTAIRAAAGKRATLYFVDGPPREGHIHGVDGPDLLFDVETSVGSGGNVSYTEKVPLSTITEIRVY